jgi:hypothetical protein
MGQPGSKVLVTVGAGAGVGTRVIVGDGSCVAVTDVVTVGTFGVRLATTVGNCVGVDVFASGAHPLNSQTATNMRKNNTMDGKRHLSVVICPHNH